MHRALRVWPASSRGQGAGAATFQQSSRLEVGGRVSTRDAVCGLLGQRKPSVGIDVGVACLQTQEELHPLS